MRRLFFVTTVLVAGLVYPGPAAAANPPHVVKDINPTGSSKPLGLAAADGLLYFSATDGKHGREPWISDGTSVGTTMLKNIAPSSSNSGPRDFTHVGTRVFFTANNRAVGRELWVTDGTTLGTKLVKDIHVGSRGSSPSDLVALGNELYFAAVGAGIGREVWKSDGTAAGTVPVRDIVPGSKGSSPSDLAAFNGRVYFSARSYTGSCCQLWSTDGTSDGTRPVLSSSGSRLGSISNLVVSGGLLYFDAASGLWRTDGTKAGTFELRHGAFDNLTAVPSGIYMTTTSSDPDSLWKSDGTIEGTDYFMDAPRPDNLTAVGANTLFFTTVGDDGWETLWQTDGTAPHTYSLYSSNTNAGAVMNNLVDVNGVLMYTFTGYLWQQGGSINGAPVVPYDQGSTSSWSDSQLTNVNGTLFYSGTDLSGTQGYEPWTYTP